MPVTHLPPALQHRRTFAGCHPPQPATGSLRLLFESALRLPDFSETSGNGDPASHWVGPVSLLTATGCSAQHQSSSPAASSPQQSPCTSMSSVSNPVLCSSCWSNHNPPIPLIQVPVTASDIFISFSFLPPHLQKTFPSSILCLSNSK